jgi:hypothetical protein
MARGHSRSQARGHPKAGETPASRRGAYRNEQRLLKGVRLLDRSGYTFQRAAREAGVSPERLRRYAHETGYAQKERGRWRVPERHRGTVLFPIFSKGQLKKVKLSDQDQKAKLGLYMQRLRFVLETNRPEWLSEFSGDYVTDDIGVRHYFETDFRVIRVLTDHFEGDVEELFEAY